jgi:hypothetical protein
MISYTTLVFSREDSSLVREFKEAPFLSLKVSDNKAFIIAQADPEPKSNYDSSYDSDMSDDDDDDGNTTEIDDESDYHSSDESEESRILAKYLPQN